MAEPEADPPLRLVTVASPFGGYRRGNPARLRLIRTLAAAFGGRESFANHGSRSGFIRQPGSLGANVRHCKVETQEEGKTRLDRRCRREADTVASRRNQRNRAVDSDAQARILSVDAGHVGVIEDHAEVPRVFWEAFEKCSLFGQRETTEASKGEEIETPAGGDRSGQADSKNWSVVRRYVGDLRYDTPEQVALLNQLYEVLHLYTNFFLPVVKLKEKVRHGNKVTKKYDAPQTPYQRVLVSPEVAPKIKAKLRAQYAQLDVVALHQQIERLVKQLWASGRRLA